MDLTAYKEGWWAQHPGEPHYDAIGSLFDHIAKRRDEGKNIRWVWLDIKNPDDFGDGYGSIQGLMTLVRDKLSNHGVAALYGFAVGSGNAIEYVKGHLREDEGINYDGSSDDNSANKTPKDTIKSLQEVKASHRIASYGWDLLSHSFGDCVEDDFYTCTELRKAKESGKWGAVFGWTATSEEGDAYLVSRLFHNAKVDGMIYGFPGTKYSDVPETREAAKLITDYIDGHREDVRLVGPGDPLPWTGPV